mmetsp:Transcript_4772/g.7690  ORF Transcript_4772/g.7690 Transcript_4772/m.7690 type:complete len:207 (+) Transcript_4772:75-695(+)
MPALTLSSGSQQLHLERVPVHRASVKELQCSGCVLPSGEGKLGRARFEGAFANLANCRLEELLDVFVRQSLGDAGDLDAPGSLCCFSHLVCRGLFLPSSQDHLLGGGALNLQRPVRQTFATGEPDLRLQWAVRQLLAPLHSLFRLQWAVWQALSMLFAIARFVTRRMAVLARLQRSIRQPLALLSARMPPAPLVRPATLCCIQSPW